jgi:ribokinase
MPKILVVGSLNMDLVVHMPAIPRPGETLLGGKFATFPGGKGANQAVAAARLGAQVIMMGKVGGDAFGQQMLQIIRDEGIDTRFVGVNPHSATGVALITVDARGQNSISIASGANFTLTAEEVRQAWDQIPEVDLLVMPLETPLETIRMAAQMANQRQVRAILNPAPAQDLDESLLRLIDVIVPNEIETEFLTGQVIKNQEDVRKAGAELLKRGVANAVLTLGEGGALLVQGGSEYPIFEFIPPFQVQAVDTTAAGDAFVGALATALGEGLELARAAHFANAVAALSVTRHGAQPSLPFRSEVDQFLQEKGRSF